MKYDENRSTQVVRHASKKLQKDKRSERNGTNLCTDLVAALSGLDMHNFTHFEVENTPLNRDKISKNREDDMH